MWRLEFYLVDTERPTSGPVEGCQPKRSPLALRPALERRRCVDERVVVAFPPIEWQEFRLQGQEWLAERASKKLKNDGLLVTSMAGSILRFEIDQVPLWRGNHVGVKQLVDDFAKYLYLPRVKNGQVILDAIQDGASRLTWSQDTFAYADYYDATADRYRGLEAGRSMPPARW